MGVVIRAYPVRGELHNQRNAKGEVAIMLRALTVKKSAKTNKDLFKGCLIALDEIPDVCSSCF